MSDESTPDEVAPTEPSTRPKDYLSETDVPVGLRETVHELYETVADGSEGGRFENVRLAFRVPPGRKAEKNWSNRAGWLVYRCELTSGQFAVPEGAPVPVIAADEPKPSGDGTWLHRRIVHPDLVYDHPQLLQKLVSALESEIFDLLHELCDAFNLLHALSQTDELPDSGADPYPKSRGGRRGYEAVGNIRPDCS